MTAPDNPSTPPPPPLAASQQAQPQQSGRLSLAQVIRGLGPIGILAVLWTAAPPLFSIPLFAYMPTISQWLQSHEGTGPMVYILAFAILGGVGVLPTYAQSGLGGFAFGWPLGIPCALAGFAGAACIGYGIARLVSGQRAMTLIERDPRARAVRDALIHDRTRSASGWFRTVGIIALLRLPPNSPFALTNLAMSAAKVPFLAFIVGTVIGMAPRTAIAVVIGSLVQGVLTEDTLKDAAPAWVWWVGIAVSIAVFLFVGWLGSRAVERVMKQQAANTSPRAEGHA